MKELGLSQSESDSCVYFMDGLLVGLWVVDFLYGGTDAAVRKFEQYLLDKFGYDQPEDAHHFYGITISQTTVNAFFVDHRGLTMVVPIAADWLATSMHIAAD